MKNLELNKFEKFEASKFNINGVNGGQPSGITFSGRGGTTLCTGNDRDSNATDEAASEKQKFSL